MNAQFSFQINSENLHRSLNFYCLCDKNSHSKILSSLCIRIPVGKWIESKITRIQSSFGSKRSTCACCNYSSTKANSLPVSADNFLELFKSLSPCKIWNKLLSSCVVSPTMGLMGVNISQQFWKSLRVCVNLSWFVLLWWNFW